MTDSALYPAGELLADALRARELVASSVRWSSWDLSPSQAADIELLLTGAFAPLGGFMVRADAERVEERLCLADGTPWPAAVTLSVSEAFAGDRSVGETIALRDPEGVMLAALHVRDIWQSPAGVCLGGSIEGVQLPTHPDFGALRASPAQTRAEISRRGWRRVLAVYPSLLLHRAHESAIRRLTDRWGAGVLALAAVGAPRAASLEYFGRVRGLEAAVAALGDARAMLTLVPLAERASETRDWLLRAVVARNFGCTDLVVDPAEETASAAALQGAGPLAVPVLDLPDMRHRADDDSYVAIEDVPDAARWPAPSAAEIARLLTAGRDVPSWMVSQAVVTALERTHPRRDRQGFTVFCTGLSGSGKSTIANTLRIRLMELTSRPVTLLDGDLVRKHLSAELGFSREHRNLNVLRIGYVASEITRHGGIAICAPIAPFDDIRRQVRDMIEPVGGFVLVHVATPLEVCEARDRKGLYAKARAGVLPQFTGVSDPYEGPADAALTFDTSHVSAEAAANAIIEYLQREGYVAVGTATERPA
jgi:sulfate adenylyltransferase